MAGSSKRLRLSATEKPVNDSREPSSPPIQAALAENTQKIPSPHPDDLKIPFVDQKDPLVKTVEIETHSNVPEAGDPENPLNDPKNPLHGVVFFPEEEERKRLIRTYDTWLRGRSTGGEIAIAEDPKRTRRIEPYEPLNLLDCPQGDPLGDEELWAIIAEFRFSVLDFARKFTNWQRADLVMDANEVERMQKVFDQYGPVDPQYPPKLLAKFLEIYTYRKYAIQRIIHWAILPYLSLDSNVERTLLPSDILALFQDLDRHSKSPAVITTYNIVTESTGSEKHSIWSHKWRRLTFELLPDRLRRHQASEKCRRNMTRIKEFIVEILPPYALNVPDHDCFSKGLDNLLTKAVVMGYTVMAYACEFRWDWNWIEPAIKLPAIHLLGKPRPVKESSRPNHDECFFSAPAFIKETFESGESLAIPITFVVADTIKIDEIDRETISLCRGTTGC